MNTRNVPDVRHARWTLPSWDAPSLRGLWVVTDGEVSAVTFGQRAAGSGGAFTPVVPTSADSTGAYLPINPTSADVEVQLVALRTQVLMWRAVPRLPPPLLGFSNQGFVHPAYSCIGSLRTTKSGFL